MSFNTRGYEYLETINEERWYVLKVVPKKEEAVKEQLEKYLALNAERYNIKCSKIVIPTITEEVIMPSGKKKTVTKPQILGVIYVKVHMDSFVWQLPRQIPNAMCFLAMGKVPCALSSDEVAALNLENNAEPAEETSKEPIYRVDDVVEFIGLTNEITPGKIIKVDQETVIVEFTYSETTIPLEIKKSAIIKKVED